MLFILWQTVWKYDFMLLKQKKKNHKRTEFNWRQIDLYIITMFIKYNTEHKLKQSSFSP